MAKQFILILLASAYLVSACHANDPRCSAPPYGDSVAAFQAFVKNLGQYVTPAKFLSSICEVKYGGADRTPMYNLGLTNQDIELKSTVDLGVDVLTALRRVAKQTGQIVSDDEYRATGLKIIVSLPDAWTAMVD